MENQLNNYMTNNTESVEKTESVETTETNMTEPTPIAETAPEQTYTVSAIAAHFDVSLPTIYRLVDKKLITPINEKSGSIKFTKSNVNAYIRSINTPEL